MMRQKPFSLTGAALKILFVVFTGVVAMSCDEKYDERNGKMYFLGYPGGSYFREAYEVAGADPASFRPLKMKFPNVDEFSGYLYAVDRNHAYRRYKVIEGADPATFRPVNEDYSVDGTQIFYWTQRLSTADPQSFRLVEEYALDAGNVYLKDKILEGADPATFTTLGYLWAKDKNAVYRGWVRMDEVSDPATFRHFGQSRREPESTGRYIFRTLFLEDDEDTKMMFMDDWACDKDFYYHDGHRIEGADYATFTLPDYGRVPYAKDRYHVFYCSINGNFIVEGSDVDTFEILSETRPLARDRNNYYYRGRIIPEADAKRVMEGKLIDLDRYMRNNEK